MSIAYEGSFGSKHVQQKRVTFFCEGITQFDGTAQTKEVHLELHKQRQFVYVRKFDEKIRKWNQCP